MSQVVSQTILRQAPDGSWWKINPDRTMVESNQDGNDVGVPVSWTQFIDAIFADPAEASIEDAKLLVLAARQEKIRALLSASASALAVNQVFLSLGAPSNAQALTQIRALTRQVNALVRLATNSLQDISDI